jgi:hypothetical protein
MHLVVGVPPRCNYAIFVDQIDHQQFVASVDEANHVADLKRGGWPCQFRAALNESQALFSELFLTDHGCIVGTSGMAGKFKTGDKVRAAPGKTMTVNDMKTAEDGSILYSCIWLEDKNLLAADFAESLLTRAPKPRLGISMKPVGRHG